MHCSSANHVLANLVARLSKFSKRYNVAAKKRDRTLAVDELSCDFYAGSITILLGANGSGKSTVSPQLPAALFSSHNYQTPLAIQA